MNKGCGCDSTTSNPISSNQVCEVDLMAPDCLNLCGNTLNDWLKAITDRICECNTSEFDLSPIQSLLQQEPTEINQCVINESLVEAIATVKQELDECCDETEFPLSEVDWSPTRAIRAIKKGRQVILTGALQASASYTADMIQLQDELIPSTNLYIPVAHDFAPSSSFNVFLRIFPTGIIKLYFNGSSPATGTSRTVYLDGVTYFLD